MGEFPEIRKYGEFIKLSVAGMWGVCVQGREISAEEKESLEGRRCPT